MFIAIIIAVRNANNSFFSKHLILLGKFYVSPSKKSWAHSLFSVTNMKLTNNSVLEKLSMYVSV